MMLEQLTSLSLSKIRLDAYQQAAKEFMEYGEKN
jgi:hypothetical protein